VVRVGGKFVSLFFCVHASYDLLLSVADSVLTQINTFLIPSADSFALVVQNECCMLKNAYHVAFPEGATPEDKMTLIGSSILVDMVVYEHQDD